MATAMQQQPYRGGSGYVARSSSSGLYDVLELILDKGLVIDVFVRVSLIGIEILTIDARIVIASVDTYLRFAEAVNRLDLMATETQGLPELMEGITEGGASSKTKGVLQGAKEALFGDEDEGDEDEDQGTEDEGGEERGGGSTRRRTASATTTKRRRRSEASGSGSSRKRKS
ncbi:MAG TPA: gas vesicle protein GvpJ [Solirubrobacterales bacterium]|nr:gas vesicle protein GvpJ [Solirubrobacterales bacterium]